MTSRTGNIFILANWFLTAASVYSSELCELWQRNEIVGPGLKPDDSLWDPVNELLYPNGTYWRESKGGNSNVSYYGCPCMLDKPCIRKCCQMNEAMHYVTSECIPHEAVWPWFQPNVTADNNYNFRMEDHGYFGLIFGNYCRGFLLRPRVYINHDKFYINFTDGTLAMPLYNKYELGVDRYCLEYIPQNDVYLPYVCHQEFQTDLCEEWRNILYPIGMITSVFFLLISLAVLLLLPDMRNMHGKCLMCHMVSFTVTCIFMSVIQSVGHLSRTACTTFGYITYFSMMCSFFWLNIMCIDIFLTFRSIKRMRGNSKERELKRFIIYFSYAFGIPLVITAVMIFLEFYHDIPEGIIKPDISVNCWFYDDKARNTYYVIPIGVIVLCNIILFVLTSYNLWKLKRETSMIHAGESKRHSNKEAKLRFNLYVKLFIVMGLSWMLEVISWMIRGSVCYWLVPDMFNTLQGLFIFLIFIFKKKVKRQLMNRYQESWSFIGSLRSGQLSSTTSLSKESSAAIHMKLKSLNSAASTSSAPAEK